jgi:hypothetical protein
MEIDDLVGGCYTPCYLSSYIHVVVIELPANLLKELKVPFRMKSCTASETSLSIGYIDSLTFMLLLTIACTPFLSVGVCT